MHFGRDGIDGCTGRLAATLIGSLFLLVLQTSSVCGQDPSLDSAGYLSGDAASQVGTARKIEFVETEFVSVHEGYVTLSWNELSDASQYVVSDAGGDVLYRGEFRQAFVSGLPDGTHTYQVWAADEDGNELARSSIPAVVNVSHWPMAQAIGCFVIGLIVFLILISVIIRGSLSTGQSR